MNGLVNGCETLLSYCGNRTLLNPAHVSRRLLLRTAMTVGAFGAGEAVLAPATAQATPRGGESGNGTTLYLLGTAGGPPPVLGRKGISSALVINGKTYLIDIGHGGYEQFHLAGLDASTVTGVLVTHLHSDHIAELFELFFLRFGGGRSLAKGVAVWGPGPAGALPPSSGDAPTIAPEAPTPGIVEFINHNIAAAAYDLNIRMRDEGAPDIHTVLLPQEIALPDIGASATGNRCPDMEPFVVTENEDCRVTATLVDHPPVFPSFAFRFDTADGSVVFSGDTTVSDNLIRLAQDADVLVHEVIHLDWMGSQGFPAAFRNHLKESHTDVKLVGGVAERAGVRRLVLSHLVPGEPQSVSNSEWRRLAQSGFSGEVVVGTDLMTLTVGPQSKTSC